MKLAKGLQLKGSYPKKKIREVMDVLINSMVEIFSQCLTNHHVYFKYLTVLFVNYTSTKI